MTKPAWMTDGGQAINKELIARIQQQMLTQDNRATSYPLFEVRDIEYIYGVDPDINSGAKRIDGLWKLPQIKTVATFFTEEGANDYITVNRHHLDEPFVYVSSCYDNKEMRAALSLLAMVDVDTLKIAISPAEQKIRKWIEAGDTEAPLDLDGFETIPKLPAGLKILYAASATSLPELPASLECLSANSVTSLPDLPASLVTLFAASATSLPELPASLESLYANSVTSLPELPSGLKYLSADSTTQLPDLPASLESLSATSATNKADRLREQRESVNKAALRPRG